MEKCKLYMVVVLLLSTLFNLAWAEDINSHINKQKFISGKNIDVLRKQVLPMFADANNRVNLLPTEISSMPEDIARQTIWLVATLAPDFDTLPIYRSILQLNNINLKKDALAMLISMNTTASLDVIYPYLNVNSDQEMVKYIVECIASLKFYDAAQIFTRFLARSNINPEVEKEIIESMQKITGVNLPNNKLEWLEWWNKNRHLHR